MANGHSGRGSEFICGNWDRRLDTRQVGDDYCRVSGTSPGSQTQYDHDRPRQQPRATSPIQRAAAQSGCRRARGIERTDVGRRHCSILAGLGPAHSAHPDAVFLTQPPDPSQPEGLNEPRTAGGPYSLLCRLYAAEGAFLTCGLGKKSVWVEVAGRRPCFRVIKNRGGSETSPGNLSLRFPGSTGNTSARLLRICTEFAEFFALCGCPQNSVVSH